MFRRQFLIRVIPTISRKFSTNPTYRQSMLEAIKKGDLPKINTISKDISEELPLHLDEFMINAIQNGQHETLQHLIDLRGIYCDTKYHYFAMEKAIIAAIKRRDLVATNMFLRHRVTIYDTDGNLLSDLLDSGDYMMLDTLARNYWYVTTLYNSWAKLMPRLAKENRDIYNKIDYMAGNDIIFNGEQMVVAAQNGNIEFMKEMITRINKDKDIPLVFKTSMMQNLLVRALHSAVENNHCNIVIYLLEYSDATLSGLNNALIIAARNNNVHIGNYLCKYQCIDLDYNNSKALTIARNNGNVKFIKMLYLNGANSLTMDDITKIANI